MSKLQGTLKRALEFGHFSRTRWRAEHLFSVVELVALRRVAPRPAAQSLPANRAVRASGSAAARGGVVVGRQPLPLTVLYRSKDGQMSRVFINRSQLVGLRRSFVVHIQWGRGCASPSIIPLVAPPTDQACDFLLYDPRCPAKAVLITSNIPIAQSLRIRVEFKNASRRREHAGSGANDTSAALAREP